MPRVARVVIPGCTHHVVQRGNNCQDVFFVDDDRRAYLRLLAEECRTHGLEILAWCLMTNHVHLLAIPKADESLAKGFGRTNFRYAQYVNRLHGRSGHLWQNRFYSCTLDELHFWRAMLYLERNPVRARLARRAADYPWSSAAAHCGRGDDPTGLLDLAKWREMAQDWDWPAALTSPQDDQTVAALRLATSRGRPLGSDSFLSKLERRLGRRLRALPVGRPKKRGSTARGGEDRK